jgi:hypothetical protein
MKQIESITGNFLSVDIEFYKTQIANIMKCDTNIKILFKRISENMFRDKIAIPKAFATIYKKYILDSDSIGLSKTFEVKQKKGKKPHDIISDNHRPGDYINSEWFENVKNIELEINKFKKDMLDGIDETGDNDLVFHKMYQKISKQQMEDPLLRKLKLIYETEISSEEISNSFMFMHKCAKKIIDVLMVPMYDVHKTITNHWDELKKAFREDTFQKQKFLGPGEIILILEQFVIAKYRATITNNNGHYVKLFFELIGNENIGAMDGPRFLEMMDNINLEQLHKEDKIYTFANSTKSILQQVVNKEKVNMEEVISQFHNLFDSVETEKTEETIKIETNEENLIL